MVEPAECVEAWCRDCGCQRHAAGARCPGAVLATGPERHGSRLLVDTPGGAEVYGTLVAPAGDRWRARLLTFPNVLWAIPRGGTIKFLASSAADVERKAFEFLAEHCRRRGFRIRTEVPPATSGEIDREQEARVAESSEIRASQRQVRAVRLRYEMRGSGLDANTDDLSEGGLFIRTDSPAAVGTILKLCLEIDGCDIPLRGVVRWNRPQQETGRPAGMGLELLSPHPRYLHHVRQTKGPAAGSGATPDPTYEVGGSDPTG